MKNLSILLVLIAVLISACNNNKTELENLKQENSKLMLEKNEKDSTINDFFRSYNEIEENLNAIKEREDIIRNVAGEGDVGEDASERINQDIQLINELMEENKRVIESLRSQLRTSNMKIGEFEKTIASLVEQVEQKDAEIATLKQQLEDMDVELYSMALTMDTMAVDIAKKRDEIKGQQATINRAFYVFGTQKELKNNGIIKKEGGFIGIGRTAKLSESFNKKYFTEININNVTSIALNTKDAKLETIHPAGSYKFVGDKIIEKLEILDPENFWSTSKYLVIVVK